jgi:hypothetical protein
LNYLIEITLYYSDCKEITEKAWEKFAKALKRMSALLYIKLDVGTLLP